MGANDFDDLTAANATYAEGFDHAGLAGAARRGLAIVTCMDARIDPIALLGLEVGDAVVFRNPGGRVTPPALEALVLGVHHLDVERVLVIPHTRCAVASNSEAALRARIEQNTGEDASWQIIHTVPDQYEALADDVQKVRTHPLIPDTVKVGGFLYDVDTGLVERQF